MEVLNKKGTPSITLRHSVLADKKFISLTMSVAYLFHPLVIASTVDNVYGFHHDCLIPPFMILSAIALYRKRTKLYILFLVMLLGLKENIPLIGSLAGLGLVVFNKSYRKIGIVTLGLSIFFFVFGLVLLPYFTGIANRHSGIITRLSSPGLLLDNIAGMIRWGVMFAFLPAVFAPDIIALSISELVMYFVARIPPYDWHVYPTICIFVIASINGLSRLLYSVNLKPSWFWKSIRSRTIFFKLSLLSLFVIPIGGIYQSYFTWKNQENYNQQLNLKALNQIKEHISQNSYLSVTSDLMVHFTNRPHLLSPTQHVYADYMLVNVRYNDIAYRLGASLEL